MALTKITSDVIGSGAVESTHIASGAISSTHLTGITTDNVSEGSSNTYFTNARARGSVSVTGGGLSYDSGTGVIQIGSIPNASLTNSSLTVNSNSVSLGGSVTLDTDDIGEGSSNLYFTNARAQGAISGGTGVTVSGGVISIGQDVATSSTPTFGNITTTGYIAGPATFTIDPAAVGDNTGTVVIAGDLQVDGTTTTINSTTVNIDDLNIQLATGAINAAAANGAGITVDGASATITYDGTNDAWSFNKDVKILGPANANGPRFYMMEDSNNGAFIKYDGSTNEGELGGLTSSGENTVMTWSRSASEVVFNENSLDMNFRVESNGDANMLFIDGGNNRVGIGTSNPQFDLDVTGLIRATSDVYLQGDVYVNSKIRHNGDVDNYIGFGTDIQSFVTGNSTRAQFSNTLVRFNQEGLNQDFQVFGQSENNLLYVDASTDRVGIGTDSPSDKVQILDSGNLALRVESTGANNQSSVWTENNSGAINGMFMYGSSHSTYGAIGAGEGAFYSNTNINIMSDSSSGTIKFSTGSAGGTERMRISSSGQVSIGTTSTTAPLRVNVATDANFAVQNTSSTVQLQGINDAANAFTTIDIAGKPIKFSANGSESMRITANGNLQMIGQTSSFESPGFTYHTNNYLYLRGGSSGLILSDDSGINTIQIIDGSSGYINFETGNGSSKMRITSAGIVDIGKASFSSYPTGAKLNVYADGEGFRLDGNSATSRFIRFRNVGTNGSSNAIIVSDGSLQLKNEDANAAMYFNSVRDMEFQVTSGNGTAGNMTFLSYNTEIMRIDGANNRVGIGETDPETSLHIKNSGNSFLTLERSGTTGGTGKFGINMEGGSSQQTTMSYDDGGKLVIGRSSDPATAAGFNNDFILKGGFVGIKTPDPQVELHVTGNANISGSTTNGGIITSNHMIRSDAGHNTARVEAIYDDGADQYDSNILMWVSEPGYTYDSGGIGVNVHASGHYYGRRYNNDYAVFMRLVKSDGSIQFGQNQGTSGTAGASQVETLKITANGTLRLATTGGIGFGTTAAADTLDDYEEGTWTPTSGTTGITIQGTPSGTYTKIGRIVYYTLSLKCNRTGSGSTQVVFSGLPFSGTGGILQFTRFEPTGIAYQWINGSTSGTSVYLTRPAGTAPGSSGGTNNNSGQVFKIDDVSATTNSALQNVSAYGWYSV